jgi:hypothetical protein
MDVANFTPLIQALSQVPPLSVAQLLDVFKADSVSCVLFAAVIESEACQFLLHVFSRP